MTARSILYDKDGEPTEDESLAVRGEVVEVDDLGDIVATYSDLSWQVDSISLRGDEGELATRPTGSSKAAGPVAARVVEARHRLGSAGRRLTGR